MSLLVRPTRPDDGAALAAIYAPLVRSSSVSFELEPPDAAEMTRRAEVAASRWAHLVAVEDERVVGYAYGGAHRARAAYGWAVETSVYVDGDHRRRGVGRRLYAELLPVLAARGFRNAYAGITLPNAASVALHERQGFERIGVFPRVGFKAGAWHDVLWLHRPLGDGDPLRPAAGPPPGLDRH